MVIEEPGGLLLKHSDGGDELGSWTCTGINPFLSKARGANPQGTQSNYRANGTRISGGHMTPTGRVLQVSLLLLTSRLQVTAEAAANRWE
ncbi:hypothetical protein R1flu_027915 [Riccia fluitans]|uniref:Ribosomal protein L2 n=1 Tax=Riccia fluitans TaxID=41844 RepID=A0ABD1XK80_9MARC